MENSNQAIETEYESVTAEIMNSRRFKNRCGRDVMAESLPLLDNPQRGMRILHIAGTNGKGSTAACINAILMAAGCRCGLFTSPHLVDFAERIQVNRENISHADVVRIGGELLKNAALGECTMFDYCLMMALLYFKEQKCDYVILETGLGGRLDSTRGVDETPVMTCITRIGYDHTDILGDTLLQIAMEKAGIIRSGVPLVLAEMDEQAYAAIKAEAEALQAPLIEARNYRRALSDRYLPQLMAEGHCPGLVGDYQMENMANAVAMADLILDDMSYDRTQKDAIIREGLKNAAWSGRMQVIRKDPLIVLDGAHNPQGIEALCGALSNLRPDGKFTFITGMLKDKDYTGMLSHMQLIAGKILVATVAEERGLRSEDLLIALKKADSGQDSDAIDTGAIEDTEIAAFLKSTADDVVICGSLHFLGRVMAILQQDKAFHFEV